MPAAPPSTVKFQGLVYRLAAPRPAKLDKAAVDALLTYIKSDTELQDGLHDSVWKKLARHVDIGDYDSATATYATNVVAEIAAHQLAAEINAKSEKDGERKVNWYIQFPADVRAEVAKELVKEFETSAGVWKEDFWNERRYKKYHGEPFVKKLNALLERKYGRGKAGKRNHKAKKMTTKNQSKRTKKTAQTVQYQGAVYRLADDDGEPDTVEKTHADVEYAVGNKHFKSFSKAAASALSLAVGRGAATLDVVISSEEGAQAYGGDNAVERYQEDPEASVFERFEIKVNALGRVP